MKISFREVCSFVGNPPEELLPVLAMQPKPISSINWKHHISEACRVRIVQATTKFRVVEAVCDFDFEPKNLWAVSFESGRRHWCRVHWRKPTGGKQWKRLDFSHSDVEMAVSQAVESFLENMVSRVMTL